MKSLKEISNNIKNAEDYVILSVGDSITEGCGASCDENSYTAVFARKLGKILKNKQIIRYDGIRTPGDDDGLLPLSAYGEPIEVQKGSSGKITVVRSGIGGNTVRRLINRKNDFVGTVVENKKADLFLLVSGINDALACDPAKFTPPENYRENLDILLDEISKENPSADIVLMTPTYNDSGKSTHSYITEYADIMISVAKKRDIPVIDLHKMWMEHLIVDSENYGQRDWLTGRNGDSCHPSDIGHEAIADKILDSLFNA